MKGPLSVSAYVPKLCRNKLKKCALSIIEDLARAQQIKNTKRVARLSSTLFPTEMLGLPLRLSLANKNPSSNSPTVLLRIKLCFIRAPPKQVTAVQYE